MSQVVQEMTGVEDRSCEVLEGVWVASHVAPEPRVGRTGRILQSEERGVLAEATATVIGSAKQVVMVSSFLLADPSTERAILEAAKRGVRVYLLVASEARLDRAVREDDEFGQRVLDEHKNLLDRLAGWVYVRTAEHFHAKFIVADSREAPRGLLLTCNLTADALRRNHELAVDLRADEARELAALFTWAFWESAQREVLEAGRLASVGIAGKIALPAPSAGVVATAGPRRDLRARVLELIRSARRRLVVATFGIGDREVVDALKERAEAGVQTTLLVRHPRPKLHEVECELARANVHVVGVSEYLHGKAIVADGERGLVMTANFELHGLDEGFEAGVPLTHADAAALEGVLATWDKQAAFRLHASRRLGEINGRVHLMNGKGFKEIVVEPLERRDGGVVDVDCCTKVATAGRPASPPPPAGRRFHRTEYAWKVRPPVLARGAKAIVAAPDGPAGRDSAPPFPIYQEPSGRRVFVVATLDEVPAAREAMDRDRVAAVVLRE